MSSVAQTDQFDPEPTCGKEETFAIFGDSISTFAGFTAEGNRIYYESPQTEITGVSDVSDTWWIQVIDELGGRFFSNASFSGSTVAGCAFPAGCSMERAKQLLVEAPTAGVSDSMPTKVSAAGTLDSPEEGNSVACAPGSDGPAKSNSAAHTPGSDGPAKNNSAACAPGSDGPAKSNSAAHAPDNVLIFIGINDYGWGGSAAQIAARSEAMPRDLEAIRRIPEGVAGAAADNAIEEFEHAYGEMLKNIRAIAPAAKIWCATLLPGRPEGRQNPAFCYQLRGKDICTYNDAIREAAENNGCELVDIAAYGYDYETVDGTHPTKRGMRQLAQLMVAAMKNQPDRVTKNEDLFPVPLRSSRTCEKATCIGCEYAQSTGNQWSCVCRKYL